MQDRAQDGQNWFEDFEWELWDSKNLPDVPPKF